MVNGVAPLRYWNVCLLLAVTPPPVKQGSTVVFASAGHMLFHWMPWKTCGSPLGRQSTALSRPYGYGALLGGSTTCRAYTISSSLRRSRQCTYSAYRAGQAYVTSEPTAPLAQRGIVTLRDS